MSTEQITRKHRAEKAQAAKSNATLTANQYLALDQVLTYRSADDQGVLQQCQKRGWVHWIPGKDDDGEDALILGITPLGHTMMGDYRRLRHAGKIPRR